MMVHIDRAATNVQLVNLCLSKDRSATQDGHGAGGAKTLEHFTTGSSGFAFHGCPLTARQALAPAGFDGRDDGLRGLSEPSSFYRDIGLHIADFQDGLAVGPGHDRPEGHHHSSDLSIIGVIHLYRNGADRRVAVAQLSYEKAGLIVEEQFDARSTGSGALND